METILFKNKYRIKSTRLKFWDYSTNGFYYITICTKNRECVFGNIVNGKIELSKIGEIVSNEWIKTGQIRKHVQLDEFVVMPNHIHGIVIIENNIVSNTVETCRGMSLQRQNITQYNKFTKPISKSLSMIINHFKSAVKRWANKHNFENFQWQPRFYEHIIRNEDELNRIREYIRNNPLQWELDREKPN